MQTPTYHRRGFMRPNYFAIVVILILGAFVLATPFRSVDSSSRSHVKTNTRPISKNEKVRRLATLASFALPSMTGESVTVYAADCTTPKISFNLGETICARTDGVDLTVPGNYYINWFHPDHSETNGGTITQNPQTFLFSLPLGNTEVGTWKVNIGRVTPPETSIIGNPPNFSVSAGPAIATFASDCTTPQTSFALGDTVCARISGEPLPDSPNGVPVQRRFNWVNASGFVASAVDVVSDPQTNSFVISNSASARGAWVVNSTGNEAEAHISAGFSVSDPAAASTDLSVGMSSPLTVNAGSDLLFTVKVTNKGPDTATGVQLTDNQPANTTFVSATQTDGEATFSCTGTSTVTCSATSMRKGDSALLVIVYNVNGGTQDGTQISNTVNVTSATTELNSADNTYDDSSTVDSGTAPTPTCTLVCPDNITVTSDTSENSVFGAHVSFEAAQPIGDCGSISTSVPSGAFFPVGTTTVNVTSQLNGGSCSFNVTVTQAPLTISCPANQSVTAAQNDTTANVNVGTPTTNPTTGVTVTGVRSDDDDDPDTPAKPLTDPYPIGVTFITWTVRETSTGRTAVCTQSIIVNTAGRPNLTISCPANQNVTAPSGQCEASVNPGTPTTNPSDSDVTVQGVRSDGAALNDPYPAGDTTITWTATDAQTGQVASCTQTITVTTNSSDTTPPTFTFVPPNVSVTTNACGQIVGETELGTPEATDTGNNCSPGTVTIFRTGVPSGNFFPTGTTTLTITARDAAGNTATATQTVTVTESPAVPPTITAPPPVTVNTGAGATSCGTVVSNAALGNASASDNCPGVVVTRSGVPAGNVFPVGTTVVTYTATDRSGNTASANQNVTVNDNTPPVVTPPAAVTLYTGAGATSCGVTVSNLNGTLGTGSATDNCPGVGAVSRSGVPAGNFFPVGQTTLTYSATDAHGNSSSATQLVTVVDNTPPVISCPADIIADFDPAVNGAVVTFTPPVGTDNCASNTAQTTGLASGSTFPVGTTTNTFTVTDASGNTASCSFKVTVAITSIIGLDSDTLSGNVIVDSYNSSIGYPASKGSLANLLSNGTVSISGSSKMFGNVRSTRVGVSLQGTGQINGNATAGTTVTKAVSAVITGTITNNALAPVMTLPSVVACSPFSSNSGISGTYSYNSSTGDLTLSSTNIATLANGSYCFHNVSLSNSGQLKVNGPVTIKLTGTLTTGGASSLNNTTQIPSNMRILSSFAGSNGVTFGNGAAVYVLLYAPTTNVSDTGSAPIYGTVVGKTITISNSGMVHYDTQLKSLWPLLWTLILNP